MVGAGQYDFPMECHLMPLNLTVPFWRRTDGAKGKGVKNVRYVDPRWDDCGWMWGGPL